TGEEYVTTLLNTGAEAIEAAIKHAEVEQQALAATERQKHERGHALLAHEYQKGDFLPRAEIRNQLGAILGRDVAASGDLKTIHQALITRNEEIVGRPPIFLALSRAFHGKTRGAASLTANVDYAIPHSHGGLRVVHIQTDDPAALAQ